MFNLGFSELLLLGAIALIFIGPKQLPELARTLGRVLNELKRASSDFQQSFTAPMKEDLMNRIDEARAKNADTPVVAPDSAHPQDSHAHGPEAITKPMDYGPTIVHSDEELDAPKLPRGDGDT